MELHPGDVRHHQVAQNHVEPLSALQLRLCHIRPGDGDDLVLGCEEALHGATDHRLVVDEEYSSAAGLHRRVHGAARGARVRRRRRKEDPEGRPLSGDAFHLDLAAQRLDDGLTDRESQTGADAKRLGGEEWVEDPALRFGSHSLSRVFHGNDRAPHLVGRGLDEDAIRFRIAVGNGLRRVDQQIEEDLAEARFVGENPRCGVELLHQPPAVTDLVEGHVDRRLQHPLEVHGADRFFVSPGEHLQVSNDRAHAAGALARLFEGIVDVRT